MKLPAASEKFRALAPAALLAAAGILAYANSFRGQFVYDDIRAIVDNPHIRQVFPLGRSLTGPGDSPTRDRPVLSFTLALNYAAGGLDPSGYHLVNLVIHILAGLTLFGILRRTFAGSRFPPGFRQGADGLAFSSALLWLLHPLQTSAVTYVIQRSESLSGLFYLLTLYCFIRGASSAGRRFWFAGAVIACALGMGTKAVTVTAPVMVFIYDAVFVSRSPAGAARRHRILYSFLAATWLIQVWLLLRTSYPDLAGLSPLRYLLTQPAVLLHYLRLAFFPHPLCLDYAWPLARGTGEVLPGALVIGGLLTLTVYGLIRKPALGFAGAWFFLILAPTSSFFPLEDPAFEHRMYLPLAAILTLAAGAVFGLLRRLPSPAGRRTLAAVLLLAVAGTFAGRTRERNRIFHDPLALWREVILLRPRNPRAYYNYGLELANAGRTEEAARSYREAIRLKPDYAEAYNNLGVLLAEGGVHSRAIQYFDYALEIKPRYWEAQFNRGMALSQAGKYREAVTAFRESLRVQPDYPPSHFQAGEALRNQGRHREATEHYRQALRLNPEYRPVIRSLAAGFFQAGTPEIGGIYLDLLTD